MRGKTSTGWFYGFKLFLVANAFGEIVKVMFTGANVADNNIHQLLKLFDKLQGWAFADKGLSVNRHLNNYCKKDYIL